MLEIRPANTLTVPSFASRTVNLDVDLGALAIRYVFSTTITDSDPGNGRLRLSATQQDAALTIRADTLDVNGADVSGLLDAFDDSTNATKGYVRIYAVGDPTKWLTFEATAVASPAGYRNITVSNVAASETSPFEDGDTVLMSFQPSGDRGAVGPSASSPADRTDLAALDTGLNSTAYLTEEGREGRFIWRAGDYSAEVTSDAGQYTYVAPASDPTGATGAWVRSDGTFVQSGDGALARPYLAKTREWLHVGDFPIAGTGTADDTAGLEAAIIEAGESKRKLVFPALQAGASIRLTDTIEMPYAITIEGDGTETDHLNAVPHRSGSWFYLDHTGIGFLHETGYAGGLIRPSGGRVKYKGIGTFRNQPASAPGWTPNPHGWDFWLDWPDVELDDIMTLNAFDGIHSLKNGRLVANNIKGQAFGTHLLMDKNYDVCRVRNIHTWPFAYTSPEIIKYQKNNSTGVVSLRNDNPQISDLFSIFMRYGMVLGRSDADPTNPGNFPGGETQRAQLANIGFDGCQTGLFIRPEVATTTFLDAVNMYALQDSEHIASGQPNIQLSGSNIKLRIANLELTEASGNAFRVDGTSNDVQIGGGVRVAAWNKGGGGFPAFEVAAGNTLSLPKRIDYGLGSGNVFPAGGRVTGLEQRGTRNGTTDANGEITVTHSLGGVPEGVSVIPTGGFFVFAVIARTATSVTVRCYSDVAFTTPRASTPVSFEWVVRS